MRNDAYACMYKNLLPVFWQTRIDMYICSCYINIIEKWKERPGSNAINSISVLKFVFDFRCKISHKREDAFFVRILI